MQTVLYLRCSTAQQSLDHQQAQAEAAGFVFDEIVADHGVSGVSTRLKERPQGKRLFDLLRKGDVLVVRWVDRLGRNYEDVCDTIREFMRRGIVIRTVINNMTFDGSTKDPVQQAIRDALIAFMAATAQASAEAIREAQKAGVAQARAAQRYLGRKPSYTRAQFEAVQRHLSDRSAGISVVAKEVGVSRQAVYRIQSDPVTANASLTAWGL